ncbi:MAG: DUF1003 domain-containing protein [Deltaproteobacteria bacterium]
MNTEFLKNIPLLSELTNLELATLVALLEPRDFKPNETIFWIGDTGADFYIVQSGQVLLTYPDEAGVENTLALLSPGDFFGEISLIDNSARTATSRAVGDTRLLCLSRENFLEFMKTHPSFTIQILRMLVHRQRETLEQLRGARNLNKIIEEMNEKGPSWNRIADKIAAFSGSKVFLLIHVFWFSLWTFGNTILGGRAFDPFPFGLLTMIVSLEAIFLSIFVLVSANRQSEKDRVRADLDYQVNLKAEAEIMRLHGKIDLIQSRIQNFTGGR